MQDFYKTDAFYENPSAPQTKLTDAYVLPMQADVEGLLYTEDVLHGNELAQSLLNWVQNLRADGIYILWYANGAKALQTRFRDGQLHGTWTQWYANGQKQAEGAYGRGEPAGPWQRWQYDGTELPPKRF